MRTWAVLAVLVVGCGGGGGPAATSTGGAPGGGGGQLGTGGAAGSAVTSTGGNTGGSAGSAATGGSAGNGQGGTAGGAAGAAGGAGGAAGGAAGAGGAPVAACNGVPSPASMCDSLTPDGPCVVPTFVTAGLPSGTFSDSIPSFGLSATYQLTSVTIYQTGSKPPDAGAGFECEGSGGVRETINFNGGGSSPNLYVAMVEPGSTATSASGGQIMFGSSTFSYQPTCAAGSLGTSVKTGRWGSTSTTVALESFVTGCLHDGKLYAGTEVDTFTLAP